MKKILFLAGVIKFARLKFVGVKFGRLKFAGFKFAGLMCVRLK